MGRHGHCHRRNCASLLRGEHNFCLFEWRPDSIEPHHFFLTVKTWNSRHFHPLVGAVQTSWIQRRRVVCFGLTLAHITNFRFHNYSTCWQLFSFVLFVSFVLLSQSRHVRASDWVTNSLTAICLYCRQGFLCVKYRIGSLLSEWFSTF